MKKTLTLLTIVMVTTSLTGCGCVRRLRDSLNRGAFCGTVGAPITPTYAAPAPAPVVYPQQVVQPQLMQAAPICMPAQSGCVPCDAGCGGCNTCCPTQSCYPIGGECCDGGCSGGDCCGGAYGYGTTSGEWTPAYQNYEGGGVINGGIMNAPSPAGGVMGDPGPVPAGP